VEHPRPRRHERDVARVGAVGVALDEVVVLVVDIQVQVGVPVPDGGDVRPLPALELDVILVLASREGGIAVDLICDRLVEVS